MFLFHRVQETPGCQADQVSPEPQVTTGSPVWMVYRAPRVNLVLMVARACRDWREQRESAALRDPREFLVWDLYFLKQNI